MGSVRDREKEDEMSLRCLVSACTVIAVVTLIPAPIATTSTSDGL